MRWSISLGICQHGAAKGPHPVFGGGQSVFGIVREIVNPEPWTHPEPPAALHAGAHILRFGARTLVMGIVNMTPDSFSGDGFGSDVDAAEVYAQTLIEDGADIVDVGGESTRPGAAPVATEEEIGRIIPLIERLAKQAHVPVSVDTRKAEVAAQALDAGAVIVNDIWGLRRDPDMAPCVAARQPVGLIVMHHQRPTGRAGLVAQVLRGIAESLRLATAHGIPRGQVIVDPGFGFGKTPAQNLELVRHLSRLTDLGQPILIGPSNKETLGLVLGGLPVWERREASLGLMALAIAAGADIVRVHDVKAAARVRRIADQVVRGVTDDVRALRSPRRTL